MLGADCAWNPQEANHWGLQLREGGSLIPPGASASPTSDPDRTRCNPRRSPQRKRSAWDRSNQLGCEEGRGCATHFGSTTPSCGLRRPHGATPSHGRGDPMDCGCLVARAAATQPIALRRARSPIPRDETRKRITCDHITPHIEAAFVPMHWAAQCNTFHGVAGPSGVVAARELGMPHPMTLPSRLTSAHADATARAMGSRGDGIGCCASLPTGSQKLRRTAT